MKRVAKMVLDGVFRALAFPAYAAHRLEAAALGERKGFAAVMQAVSLWPGVTGEWFRRAVLQWVTGQPLRDCCIGFGTTFSDPRVRIGDGVYIGTRCDIGWAEIGAHCVIGSGVHILSGLRQHFYDRLDVPIRDQGGEFQCVRIGEDCWIGNGAVVGADVGAGSVVGAGAVVVKPLPERSIVAGNPARVVGRRGG